MKQQPEDTGANSFASLFEKSLVKMEKLQPGQMVETQIVSISKDCVFLQLSGKSEGVMDKAEITDKDGNLTAKEGDSIKVYFLTAKGGEMRFTTRIAGNKAGSAMLENAFASKIPVDGLVEKEIKGGYEIKLGETRAFCPFSQMGLKRSETAETCVGKRLTFKIQEYKEGGRKIVVSNRVIEEEARQEQLEALKKTIKEKEVIKGTIKSIQDFGAFVDLGGVQALLPVSEISRTRVEDIRAVLTVGQEIEAEIIKVDWASERITLSLKSLLSDPWSNARDKYPRDSRHSGTVVRVTDFGAFVSLEPGLDGLLHISELRGEDKYGNPKVPVTVGQKVEVQILDVDVAKRRVSLKQANSPEDDEASKKYLDGDSSGDTYNPFAALLKKK